MNPFGFSENQAKRDTSRVLTYFAHHYKSWLPILFLWGGCWAYGFFTVFNTDFGFSVKMGQYLREHHYQIPHETIFLADLAPRYSPDDKWIFHLLCSWFYDLAEINGLIYFRLLLIGTAFFFLYQTLRLKRSSKWSLFFCLAAILATSEQFMIRATLLSITFLCFHLYLYCSSITPKKGILLGVTLWIWANSHAYFILGQILFLGWFVVHFISKTSPFSKKILGKALLLCFLIPLFNPHGMKVYHFPWTVLQNLFSHSEYYQNTLTELVSPFAHEDFPSWTQRLYFLSIGLCFLGVLRFIRKAKNKSISQEEQILLCWLFGFFVMSLLARKNIGVWIPVATVFLAFQEPLIFRTPKKKRFSRFFGFFFAGIGYLYYLWLPLSNTLYIQEQKQQRSQWGLSEMIFPQKAVDYLLRHQLPMPIFNNYEIGSYLVYRCFPQTPIRPYILTDYGSGGLALIDQYQKILRGKIPLTSLKESEKIRTFLLKHTSANTQYLIQQLFCSTDYELVYVDALAVLFVDRATAKNLAGKREEHLSTPVPISSLRFFREIPWEKFYLAGFFQQRNTLSSLQTAENLYLECLEEYADYPKAQMNLASLEATLSGKKGFSIAIFFANHLQRSYPAYRQAALFREQLRQNLQFYQSLLNNSDQSLENKRFQLKQQFQEKDSQKLQNWLHQQEIELLRGTMQTNQENVLRAFFPPLERERWRLLLEKFR